MARGTGRRGQERCIARSSSREKVSLLVVACARDLSVVADHASIPPFWFVAGFEDCPAGNPGLELLRRRRVRKGLPLGLDRPRA